MIAKINVLAMLLNDSRELLTKDETFYSGATLACYYNHNADSYTIVCGNKSHSFTFNEMIETSESEYKLETSKMVTGHESFVPVKPMLEVKGLQSCFFDEIKFLTDSLTKIVISDTYHLDIQMAKLAANAEMQAHVKSCRSKQRADAKREHIKAQAAKLAGGAKVASRNNTIGFGEELLHKSGSDKKINLKQRNKAVEFANRRVGFKAKESYNSTGAVRGGSSLLYTSANEPYKRPNHRTEMIAVNPIVNKK